MRVNNHLINQQKKARRYYKLLQGELGEILLKKVLNNLLEAFLSLKPYQAGKMAKDSFGKKLRDAWAEIW